MSDKPMKRIAPVSQTVESLLEKVSQLEKKNLKLDNQVLKCENEKLKLEHKMFVLQKKIDESVPPHNLAERLKEARERVRKHRKNDE